VNIVMAEDGFPASAIFLLPGYFPPGTIASASIFDQHFRRDQGGDRQHGARGADVAEKFSVCFSHLFPVRNVG